MGAIEKMKAMVDHALAAVDETKKNARAHLARLREEKKLTTKTVTIAVGTPTLPLMSAFLVGRFVAPEHGKWWGGAGAGLSFACTVGAIAAPDYAEWLILGSSFFVGPAIGEAYVKAQKGYQEAHADAAEAE